ncbi:MAG: MBL fold metallo-hydrolase [Candidatus Micrarchaeota archaeon]
MQIIFIGTGGGRVNLIKQFRGTGGFLIKGSVNVYVDPGPGALLGCIKSGVDVEKINVLVVTHAHIDHMNDAELMLEGMTHYTMKKQGIVVASANVLEGSENFDRSISRYHQGKVEKCVVGKSGDKIKLGENAELELTKVNHDDKSGFGFVLKMDGKKLGYTSDTEYEKGFGKQFAGVDYLIVNNLKPLDDGIPDHLSTKDSIEIIKEAKPKLAILSHLGMEFIKKPAEVEAEFVREKTGVETIAARDGMKIGEEVAEEKGKTKKKEKKLSEY